MDEKTERKIERTAWEGACKNYPVRLAQWKEKKYKEKLDEIRTDCYPGEKKGSLDLCSLYYEKEEEEEELK
jgi:hypothetical protein